MIRINFNALTRYGRTLLLTAVVAAATATVGTICLTGCDNGGTKPNRPPEVGETDSTGTGTDSTDTGTEPGAVETVTIGGKTWMAKNLNTEVGNSWCYGDEDFYCKKYGRLYDWNTATTACPTGWRLPTDKEWDDLAAAAGGASTAGTKLKSQGDWDYNGINGGGNDSLGFSALPGGARFSTGGFSSRGFDGYWWSATESDNEYAYYRNMSCQRGNVDRSDERKARGHSVRCVKD